MHFSSREGNLFIQVLFNQTKNILVLIPPGILWWDLPTALIDGHVHWLNPSEKTIEIRPLDQLWERSSEHWRVDCASAPYRLYRGCETLVDIRSATWEMAFKCFKCLNVFEEPTNLLITTRTHSLESTSVSRLSVTLLRHGLSFFVNETGELESHDFKDMVYDENQCVGALFGLENLLVLRPKTHILGILIPDALIPRRVITPNGFPEKHGDHQVRIVVSRYSDEFDEPPYHVYDVDAELGCLTGNGTLTSIRHLAYLHAITSCHQPDPLTGKTGVQAALCLLQSAGCRSIMKPKAFDDHENWTSTQYPQINASYQEILNRYYWSRSSYWHRDPSTTRRQSRAGQQAAYLIPSPAAEPTPQEDRIYHKNDYFTARIPVHVEPGLHTPPHITLDQLISSRPAPQLPLPSSLPHKSHKASSSNGIHTLVQLFTSLRADSPFQRQYLARLDVSAQYVRVESQMTHKVTGENHIEALKKHYVQCRGKYLDALDALKKSLGPTADPREQALDHFSQWPIITVDILLRYLASTSPIDIPPRWKNCLISLALLISDLQRARRLLRFVLAGQEEEYAKELENEGCDGWNPEEYPDWLLIQVAFFRPNSRLY